MKEIKFRSGYPSDAHKLLDIHRKSIINLGREAYTCEECESWAHGLVLKGYRSAMDRGERFIIAVSGDEIVGFSSYVHNEIVGLFVDPEKARQGIGTQLLNKVEDDIYSEHSTLIFLDAALSAVPFYKAHGYVELRSEPWKTRGGKELLSIRMSKIQ
jgi:putative acetyltransferase